jgi:hypothetical protein
MYGINAGYDSRPMATGGTTDGVSVTDSQTVFFQQVALNLEANSNKLSISAYALVPVGEYGAGTGNVAVINSSFIADNLSTYGLDIGYKIKPYLNLALGAYYQLDEKEEMKTATGFGVKTGLTYDITNELQAGIIYSYDENFESRISGNLKWRFGGSSARKKKSQPLPVSPVIQALTATPANRDVRVANCYVRNRNADGSFQRSFWSWNCGDGISDGADIWGNRGGLFGRARWHPANCRYRFIEAGQIRMTRCTI